MGRLSFAVLAFSILLAASPAVSAADAPATDLTQLFRPAASGVDRLQVFEVSGIVVIRGRVSDRSQAEALTAAAYQLGFQRVANLVQTVTNDDAGLTRAAERELTIHRALDGCQFNVTTDSGVLRVAGKVRHELQKDVAYQVLRSIDGVRSIDMQLTTF